MDKLFIKHTELGEITFNKDLVVANGEYVLPEEINDEIKIEKTQDGYVVERILKNCSERELKIKELKFVFDGIRIGEKREKDYFYCNENARIYGVMTIPVQLNRQVRTRDWKDLGIDTTFADPDTVGERICASPYQPFPAILISNYESTLGVVHGSLSQDVFFHNYTVCNNKKGVKLIVYSSFKSIEYRIVKPNEILVDKWFVGITRRANDINSIFEEYANQLRRSISWKKERGANRKTLIWDSWNDGVFRNVSEKMLVEEAKVLKKKFPTVEWFQLDDGYSSYCHENVDFDAHGMGVVYEGETGIDRKKFPSGLKSYVNKIKDIGLRPAIWIGGFCPKNSKIYKEKKGWFIDYNYRVEWTAPLDVSLPEVREYMLLALDKFFVEYGFEGVKHDFWSYAFEDSHDLLTNKEKSGYEYRRWWLSEIRKRLPSFGYMESGCDIGLGNPFLGEFFDNYRYGLDVADGNWDKVKTTMFWGVACTSTHTGDMFIPNGDSIGLMQGLGDNEYIFLLNYLIATGSLVEISGLYSKIADKNRREQILKNVAINVRNGIDAIFINYDYRRKGRSLPEIIYNKTEQLCFIQDEKITGRVTLFNSEEDNKEISFSLADLGVPCKDYILIDLLTNEKTAVNDTVKVVLPPRSSVMFYLKELS